MRKYPTEGESVHERDARFWDNFYSLTRSFRVFESDTDPYRQQRAVEVFIQRRLAERPRRQGAPPYAEVLRPARHREHHPAPDRRDG